MMTRAPRLGAMILSAIFLMGCPPEERRDEIIEEAEQVAEHLGGLACEILQEVKKEATDTEFEGLFSKLNDLLSALKTLKKAADIPETIGKLREDVVAILDQLALLLEWRAMGQVVNEDPNAPPGTWFLAFQLWYFARGEKPDFPGTGTQVAEILLLRKALAVAINKLTPDVAQDLARSLRDLIAKLKGSG